MTDPAPNGSQKAEKLLKSGVPASAGKATQIKKGQVLNPAGRPKGSLNLSTLIQRMLMDEEFTTLLPDKIEGWKEHTGAPAKAIVKVLMLKAMQGDIKAFDTLAKYGYGTKIELTGEDGGPVKALVEFIDPSGEIPKASE
ncbi:hypothetical protein EDF22_1335 [Rathayibacter sp. PhB127]|uniref:DUF5681 domain-containing protein n=1 Tax=Rathayibacter sp. PhB127 TaxID=2485176 RepID=UPI000F941690|nr:DUF5681 domain-containing protein [Rathayibacter sp. PhB127]ROS29592.1 hypothetical protein EDF22_1335 [Rathayibacter sp. PhB127]